MAAPGPTKRPGARVSTVPAPAQGANARDEAGVDAVVDAVVDAIFGTGFRGPVRDVPAAALAAMNAAGGRKIAVDIPSGLDADSGRAAGVVFRADVTATMGARKLGLVIDASAPVGRIELVELGAPVDARIAPTARCRLLDAAGIAARVPRRSADAHKGSSGHLLVVAGSAGKTGAAFLVGTAALRTGAGLVTIASTAAGQSALDAKAIELMTARYTDGEDAVPAAALAALEALAGRAQAVALGPGIPTGAGMRAVVHELASRLPLPMVIDADALNALGTEAPKILERGAGPAACSPHTRGRWDACSGSPSRRCSPIGSSTPARWLPPRGRSSSSRGRARSSRRPTVRRSSARSPAARSPPRGAATFSPASPARCWPGGSMR